MITHGIQRITDLRRGTWQITSMTRGTFDILGLFSSPYSREATAALQAAFTTQWETIRDYGWQHPALVPFINEDPMLVCSLIPELGKERWLISDGDQSIDTNIQPFSGVSYSARLIFDNIQQPDFYSPCGWRNSTDSNCYFWITKRYNDTYVAYGTTSEASKGSINIATGTIYNFEFHNGGCSLGSNTKTWSAYSGGFTHEANFNIFRSSPSHNNNRVMRGKIAWVKINNGNNVLHHFVPCLHKVEGVLQGGMLDIIEMKWWGNVGTGDFTTTISETPAA